MTEFARAYRKCAPALNRTLELLGVNWSAYAHAPTLIHSGTVDLHGTPYERGLAHGRMFRSIIPDLIQRNLRSPLGQVDSGLLEAYRRKLLGYYSSKFHQVIQEIEGIAEGAKLSFLDVFDYNIQPILLLDLFPRPESCTSIWLKSLSGEFIHAGSLDSGPPDGSYLVKRVSLENGRSYLGGMVVGTTWTTFGMNDAGLTIGGSSVNSCMIPVLKSERPDFDGLEADCLASIVLESASNVQEAEHALDSPKAILPLNSGSNLVISDAAGNAVKVESYGRERNYVPASDPILFCSNHYTDKMSALNRHDTPLTEALHSASAARYDTMQRHFDDRSNRTLTGVKKILKWHQQPGAICRHYGRNQELGQTTISYIMLPSQKMMYYWLGNPCQRRLRVATAKASR